MKIATAPCLDNVPHAAVIYGVFTQPFGADVARKDAIERLETIIENNGPNAYVGRVAKRLAKALLKEIDFPNAGCEVTFVLYTTED